METQTSKHTATPWKIEEWSYENGKRVETMIHNDQDAIAQMSDLWCPDDRQAEKQANAEFIVNACNEHEEMRFALENLLSDVRALATRREINVEPVHIESWFSVLRASDILKRA